MNTSNSPTTSGRNEVGVGCGSAGRRTSPDEFPLQALFALIHRPAVIRSEIGRMSTKTTAGEFVRAHLPFIGDLRPRSAVADAAEQRHWLTIIDPEVMDSSPPTDGSGDAQKGR